MSIYSKCKSKGCKKKVFSAISKCKCEKCYCPTHKFKHNCTFNYREKHKEFLKKNNPIIESTNFIRI